MPRVMFKICGVAALIGAALAQPTAAAEQSPEGAIEFLKMILGDGSTKVLPDWGNGFGRLDHQDFGRDGSTRFHAFDAEITPVQSVQTYGQCKLGVTFKYSKYPDDDHSQRISYDGGIDFDFSRVSKIEEGGESVTVSGDGKRKLVILAPGLDDRVAFAMEFLRLHCDRTAKTGF